MRNKWIKRFFPLIVLLLLAPWPVAYVYADNDNITSQDTARIEITEASIATNTATEDAITAPEEVLPSHVYVLNNREIVTERPSSEIDKPKGNAEEPSSHSATIEASVTVASSRLIVVDENNRIVGIWSNTTGTKRAFYSLRVKELSVQGLEHPLTPEILAQYNRLLGEVDWTEIGQVYSITTVGYAN